MSCLGHEHVFSFENFITKDDREEIIRFYENEYEWDKSCTWSVPAVQFNNGLVEMSGKYRDDVNKKISEWPKTAMNDLMLKYGEMIMKQASKTFGRTLVHRLTPYLKRFNTGDDHNPHADSESMDSSGTVDFMPRYSPGEFNTPILIEVAANLYLNDEFEGGELYFPGRGLSIKPKAGQLILFPGGHEYIHGVSQITSGKRYVLFSPLTSPQRLMLHMNAYNLHYELENLRGVSSAE